MPAGSALHLHARVRPQPDAVDVGGILEHVEQRDQPRAAAARVEQAVGLAERAPVDPHDVVVGLGGIRRRRRDRQRAADRQQAEAGVGLPARPAEVARRQAHRLVDLVAVSVGRAARTHATAAATIGAEKLVPLWRS